MNYEAKKINNDNRNQAYTCTRQKSARMFFGNVNVLYSFNVAVYE